MKSTLVLVLTMFLCQHSGNTVSNLSSTRALAEVTRQYGGDYVASAVGEAHVVEPMKTTLLLVEKAMVGRLPDLHYGRDAWWCCYSSIYANRTVCFCFAKPIPKLLREKLQINLTQILMLKVCSTPLQTDIQTIRHVLMG